MKGRGRSDHFIFISLSDSLRSSTWWLSNKTMCFTVNTLLSCIHMQDIRCNTAPFRSHLCEMSTGRGTAQTHGLFRLHQYFVFSVFVFLSCLPWIQNGQKREEIKQRNGERQWKSFLFMHKGSTFPSVLLLYLYLFVMGELELLDNGSWIVRSFNPSWVQKKISFMQRRKRINLHSVHLKDVGSGLRADWSSSFMPNLKKQKNIYFMVLYTGSFYLNRNSLKTNFRKKLEAHSFLIIIL